MTSGCRAKLFLSKKSSGLEKSRFSVSNWKSDEKHDFWKKVSPTSDMQRNLVCFLSKLLRVYTARENCILRVHLNIFKTKKCFWKNQYFFSYFWDIDRFFLGLLAKVFCQVCKTATYLPRGTVQEKKFSKVIEEFLSLSENVLKSSSSVGNTFR